MLKVFSDATFHQEKNYSMASRRKVINELVFFLNSLVAASREFNYSGRQRMFGKTITAVKSSKWLKNPVRSEDDAEIRQRNYKDLDKVSLKSFLFFDNGLGKKWRNRNNLSKGIASSEFHQLSILCYFPIVKKKGNASFVVRKKKHLFWETVSTQLQIWHWNSTYWFPPPLAPVKRKTFLGRQNSI